MPEEITQIEGFLSQSNAEVHPLMGNENPGSSNLSLILLKIEGDQGYRKVRQFIHNNPGHYYGYVIRLEERELIYKIFSRQEGHLLFLPLLESEVVKTYLLHIEKSNHVEKNKLFLGGLTSFSEKFQWKSSEIDISQAARHATNVLKNLFLLTTPFSEVNLQLGLEEVITNALEHGNLELTSSDKPMDLEAADRFEKLRYKRLQNKKFSNRKIYLNISIEMTRYIISVEDEGPGFDTSFVMNIIDGRDNITQSDIINPSGKGFWLLRKIFKSIEFEKNGRKIILKNFVESIPGA